jgi:hypothetical protein
MKLDQFEDYENIPIRNVKFRLPKKALKAFQNHGGGEEEMYYFGEIMGGRFMTTKPPNTKGNQPLYVIPPHITLNDILSWDVVEITK